MIKSKSISFDEAKAIAEAALKSAGVAKRPIAITVLNSAGKVLCAYAMDGVSKIACRKALDKAMTAIKFGYSTREFGRLRRLDDQSWKDFGDNCTGVPGGIVIIFKSGGRSKPKVAGAVGVDGLGPNGDEALAIQILKSAVIPNEVASNLSAG